jgi:hypothetical protein
MSVSRRGLKPLALSLCKYLLRCAAGCWNTCVPCDVFEVLMELVIIIVGKGISLLVSNMQVYFCHLATE